MIQIENLRFAYPRNGFRLAVDLLRVQEGEKLCIMGPSGSGKTTLIHLISGILMPDSGSIRVAGQEITRRNDRWVRSFRLSRVGFIFQDFKLLEYLTAEQNILLPYYLSRQLKLDGAVRERLAAFLERTGLNGKAQAFPEALSHGEKQRVAVLRALITLPALVIGDEPTANLDEGNAAAIMELILRLVKDQGAAFILVTHNPSFRERFDRRLELERGMVKAGT